jgi:hypothetical protein
MRKSSEHKIGFMESKLLNMNKSYTYICKSLLRAFIIMSNENLAS